MTHDLIVRRKLSDEVLDRLKAMIICGEFAPGDAMPSERDLMERFGVGRPAIREAMQALAKLGLISITHGERARVRELTAQFIFHQVDAAAQIMLLTSPASLEHLKEVRRFFERGMVREAALKASDAEIAQLRATLDQQRRSLGDAPAFIAEDMKFHTQIAMISGNPLFVAVSEAMLTWLRAYHTNVLIWTGKEKYTLAEHTEIIERIAAHDPDGADEAMVKHLDRSSALYVHHGEADAAEPPATRRRRPKTLSRAKQDGAAEVASSAPQRRTRARTTT
jgi:DNA-binding FadR family transcriptional regulator